MIQIQITKKDIMDTTAFKELSKMVQSLVLKRTNMLAIQNGVNIALNRGYELWEKQSGFNIRNKAIVEELLKKYGE